jgi:predicted alpha/beta superfamily hydrolase
VTSEARPGERVRHPEAIQLPARAARILRHAVMQPIGARLDVALNEALKAARRRQANRRYHPIVGTFPDSSEHTVVGHLTRIGPLASEALGNEREVLVWLPSSYAVPGDRRYPVIYMQDGQNLFDQATAFGEEWQVDENIERLSALGLESIVVGIPNVGGSRLAEYSPFEDERHGGGRGDAYLDFVIGKVKPLVDRDFRTRPDRDHTGVMGSSMGGLISLYAFFRHPRVFGFAGAMSPSLWFAGRRILDFVREQPHVPGRVYLDMGTGEGEAHVDHVHELHRILLEQGYRQGTDLFYVEEDDAEHREDAWSRRLRTALYFLLPPLV